MTTDTALAHELTVLLRAVEAAGGAILQLQTSDLQIANKSNNDIVTIADFRANDILKSTLNAAFPTYGWLSEETLDDAARLNCQRVWIVDPIDGTREYANHIPEYAVSVALVEQGIPIVAAVYNPATHELFYAVKDQGAWLNHTRIYCDHLPTEQLCLLASRSEIKRGEWDFAAQHLVKPIGSIAYKLALIAAGKADATFSLGPKNEWDIAAGVLLVQEAGGLVSDQTKKRFLFNQPQVLVQGIVASSQKAHERLFAMIAKQCSV